MTFFLRFVLCTFLILPSVTYSVTLPQNKPDSQPPFETSTWVYRNEEHWAVDQMCRDITEMLMFAADRDTAFIKDVAPVIVKTEPLADLPHSYVVTITDQGRQIFREIIVLKDYLWQPAILVPLVQQLSKAWNVAPQINTNQVNTNVDESTLIGELLSPTPERLEKAQMKVSEMLTQYPRSPHLHEQAAFCLAVFGLFNCTADIYTDNRHTLNRLTAHLAIAQAWHLGSIAPTPSRIISEIALLCLAGRTAQSVERANEQLKQHLQQHPSDSLCAWLNVLRLAASTDWRLVVDPSKVTDAERLMAFYARVQWLGQIQAKDWLDKAAVRVVPAFVRRAMLVQRLGPGQSGDTFAKETLAVEHEDISKVLKVRRIEVTDLNKLLNAYPKRAINPQLKSFDVIGWGMWARYFQANILFCLDRILSSIEEGLGDRQGALDFFKKTCEVKYSELELYPVLMRRHSNLDKDLYSQAVSKFADIVRRSPELISDSAFVSMCQSFHSKDHSSGLPPNLPHYCDWLALPFLFGTTYGGYQRVREMSEFKDLSAMLIFLELNPYHAPLIRQLIKSAAENNQLTPQLIERVFAHTRDFAYRDYPSALRQISYDDTEKYIEYTKRLVLIEPCEYFKIGEYLAELGRDEEAKQAYLDGNEKCQDIVLISNNLEWIMTYLFVNDNKTEAESLAKKANGIGSARGLMIYAKFLEMQGKLNEAEHKLKEIKNLYSVDYFLNYFYIRNAVHYPTQAQELIKKFFPKGLCRFEPPLSNAPPQYGIRLIGHSQTTKRLGIPHNAILVAIDGYTVETKDQYHALMNLSFSCDVTFTVFTGSRYQTCVGKLYIRRLYVEKIEEVSPTSK